MHLFLSPHLDDAVYSCGGTIHQLARAGEHVHILTVMAGDPPQQLPDTPIIHDLHRRWAIGPAPITERRAEDEAAAACVGATIAHLDIPDCVYRTGQGGKALYPTEESLWYQVHPDDPALQIIPGFRLPEGTHQLYIPMGVGGHVDHLIVRDMGIGLITLLEKVCSSNINLYFYPEYPYSEDAKKVTLAEQHLDTLPASVSRERVTVELTAADIAAKIESVRAYHSQISTFWENETALATRVRAALHSHGDTPAEYFIRIQKGE